MIPYNEWTDEMKEKFRSMYEGGIHVDTIGLHFGLEKLTIWRRAKLMGIKRRRTTEVVDVPRPDYKPAVLAKNLTELTSKQCHYPVGDPKSGDFGYCGKPVHKNQWCKECFSIVYR